MHWKKSEWFVSNDKVNAHVMDIWSVYGSRKGMVNVVNYWKANQQPISSEKTVEVDGESVTTKETITPSYSWDFPFQFKCIGYIGIVITSEERNDQLLH